MRGSSAGRLNIRGPARCASQQMPLLQGASGIKYPLGPGDPLWLQAPEAPSMSEP